MRRKDFIDTFLGVISFQLVNDLPKEASEEKYRKLTWLSLGQLNRHIKFAETLAKDD